MNILLACYLDLMAMLWIWKKKVYLEISYIRAVLLNKYEFVKMNSFNSLDIFQGLWSDRI